MLIVQTKPIGKKLTDAVKINRLHDLKLFKLIK